MGKHRKPSVRVNKYTCAQVQCKRIGCIGQYRQGGRGDKPAARKCIMVTQNYLAWTGGGNDNLSPLLTQETYAVKIKERTANFLPQNRLLHNLSSDRD